jgi:hypothetical protein
MSGGLAVGEAVGALESDVLTVADGAVVRWAVAVAAARFAERVGT